MIDWKKTYKEIERMESARRFALTTRFTLFPETAPLRAQGRPQVVIPLNV